MATFRASAHSKMGGKQNVTTASISAPKRFTYKCIILLASTSILTGCVADQNSQKETAGTGLGAVVGGVAGALVGKGRALGILIGAAAGGFIGNRIGALLDDDDKKALQEQAKDALRTQPDNQQVTWNSGKSDASATVVPTNTRKETREVRILRDANVAPISDLDLIGAQYEVKAPATVRLAPSQTAAAATNLPKASKIWAVGKVRNQPWVLVARDGKSIGYVPAASVSAAKPAPAKAATATAKAADPFDLDAAAPVRPAATAQSTGVATDVVVASVQCRDIQTTATTKGTSETASQTACKSPDGSWELD